MVWHVKHFSRFGYEPSSSVHHSINLFKLFQKLNLNQQFLTLKSQISGCILLCLNCDTFTIICHFWTKCFACCHPMKSSITEFDFLCQYPWLSTVIKLSGHMNNLNKEQRNQTWATVISHQHPWKCVFHSSTNVKNKPTMQASAANTHSTLPVWLHFYDLILLWRLEPLVILNT